MPEHAADFNAVQCEEGCQVRSTAICRHTGGNGPRSVSPTTSANAGAGTMRKSVIMHATHENSPVASLSIKVNAYIFASEAFIVTSQWSISKWFDMQRMPPCVSRNRHTADKEEKREVPGAHGCYGCEHRRARHLTSHHKAVQNT